MAQKAIPASLEPAILEKAGLGWTAQATAEWLGTEHGVKASRMAVQRLLAKVAAERRPIAEAVVREKLGKTLTSDLDAVSGILRRAGRDEARARRAFKDLGGWLFAGSPEWARCMSAASQARGDVTRALELRFKLAGASGATEDDAAVVRSRLLAKMEEAKES